MFWVGLILVLLLSGLVAYLGDMIGRRIGRKRLTWLGLRPRHTAVLFTVLTGALIALLAVGVVLAASQDVRNRVLHFHQLLDQQAQTLAATEVRLGSVQRSRELAKQQLDAANAELSRAEKRAAAASRQAGIRSSELRAANAAVAAAEGVRAGEQARRPGDADGQGAAGARAGSPRAERAARGGVARRQGQDHL
ncbi:MAG: DUF3084 domain-containing protein [Armatimonadetes bacterium]|nr:DUF3084 domain-containing protein [Armatimonadota bacterium]